MTSEANNLTTWQANLDPALLRRLLRPLTRPGVIRQAQGHRILARLRHMAAGLPLLDQLSWYVTLLDDASRRAPIVYALPVRPELPATPTAALVAGGRPVVAARVPPAAPPDNAGQSPRHGAPNPQPPAVRPAQSNLAEHAPSPVPRRMPPELPDAALARPARSRLAGEPGEQPHAPAAPIQPAAREATEAPLRIILPPSPRRTPAAAPNRPSAPPGQRAAAWEALSAPKVAPAGDVAERPAPQPVPGNPLERPRAAVAGERPPLPVVAARAGARPAVMARRQASSPAALGRPARPIVSAAEPAVVAGAPPALPVARRPEARPVDAHVASPGTATEDQAAAPVAGPRAVQRQRPPEPMPEGEAVRLADRVYDLIARRIAAERGRRGW